MRKGWIIVGVVFVISAGIAGWWYYTKKSSVAATAEKAVEPAKAAKKGRRGKGPGGPLVVRPVQYPPLLEREMAVE